VFRFHANAIEALIELGQVGRARDLLDAFEVHGDPFVGVWTAATAARCRGLVRAAESDLGEAFLALEEALEHHDRLAEPFELGRTRLVLGVLQRRSKRRMGARESLRRALEVFDDLGAMLWSSKARAELDRIGGRVPDRWRLTHTERKVAELASIGRTNREIAASLYLSPKTVEVNLTRIYRKLGIRSRTELARRVPPEGFTQPELTGEPKPGKQ
jgi:DNA-binding CsgD family transcriptional regulator